jgi:hypothetical protein
MQRQTLCVDGDKGAGLWDRFVVVSRDGCSEVTDPSVGNQDKAVDEIED